MQHGRRYGATRAQSLLVVTLAVVLLVAAARVDAAGRVLFLVAAAGLLGLGARDLLLQPALSADLQGLTVVPAWRRLHADWAEVAQLRVVTDRRAPLLEIDLGAQLVVLSRHRLGRTPAVVLAELEAVRATAAGTRRSDPDAG